MAARVQEKADMFSRMVRNGSLRLVCWVVMFSLTPAVAWAQNHPKDTEWPSYAADTAGTRHPPLDQINASNFSDPEIGWRLKTGNFCDRPEYKLQGTPPMVNGGPYARSAEHTAQLQSPLQ